MNRLIVPCETGLLRIGSRTAVRGILTHLTITCNTCHGSLRCVHHEGVPSPRISVILQATQLLRPAPILAMPGRSQALAGQEDCAIKCISTTGLTPMDQLGEAGQVPPASIVHWFTSRTAASIGCCNASLSQLRPPTRRRA